MIITKNLKNALKIFILLALIFLIVYWWTHTPAGASSKLHAIGYSVCHQIPSHSFKIGEKSFPLCSRCMGLYLGNIIGFLVLLPQRKRSGIPAKKYLLVFALFALTWLVDGANSFINGFLGKVPVYPPSNLLRLITGLGMGLSMSTALFILFNLVAWKKKEKVSPIRSPLPIMIMLITAAALVPMILAENEILMTIFAYLSTGAIVIILSALYTIVWIILLHKENTFSNMKELMIFWMAGLFFAFLQITLLDALRFTLTGTWISLR